MIPGARLGPGIHDGVPMRDYLALPAIGSTHLGWLAVSPLHYRWMSTRPPGRTDATDLGTMLHAAVLEPDTFSARYAMEPDLDEIGGAKPRATKAYREARAELEAGGRTVMKSSEWEKVNGMARSILRHSAAVKLFKKAPRREVTMLWDSDGILCRGRADLYGEGVHGDLKTTRNLRRFSPHVVTSFGYYRQSGWYSHGAGLLGEPAAHTYYVAVENVPPYDCGVFAMDPDAVAAGRLEAEGLLERLRECLASDEWPGMFPWLMRATITDAVALDVPDEEIEQDA
jgi:exodeoxyribonuclease VIII